MRRRGEQGGRCSGEDRSKCALWTAAGVVAGMATRRTGSVGVGVGEELFLRLVLHGCSTFQVLVVVVVVVMVEEEVVDLAGAIVGHVSRGGERGDDRGNAR